MPEKANWKIEMEVKINGVACAVGDDKPCKIVQDKGVYVQMLSVDAKVLLGEACKEGVEVSIEIKPVPDSEIVCDPKTCQAKGVSSALGVLCILSICCAHFARTLHALCTHSAFILYPRSCGWVIATHSAGRIRVLRILTRLTSP
jgi:hypothetical protein